jgi:hypothetical protein
MARLEVGILDNALRGTLPDKRTIRRIVFVVHFRKEPVKGEMAGLFAAGVLFAQAASHASDLADLAHIWSAKRIVAENMNRGLRRNKLDYTARAHVHALAAADAETLINLRKTIHDGYRMLRADIRTGAIAKASEAAALVATCDSRGGGAIRNAVVVANADCVRASSAAVDDCDALFRSRSGNTKNLGDFRYALVVSGGARTVSRRTGDKSTGIAVASWKAASTAVRTRQGRRDETDTRILLNRKILVGNCKRKRCDRTHTCNNSYGNQNSCHLFSSLISTNNYQLTAIH